MITTRWLAAAVMGATAVLSAQAASIEAETQRHSSFRPGEEWRDTGGVHINAHGGGIMHHDGVYYWYGEHKSAGRGGSRALVGVNVYSSTDLIHWTKEGVALPVTEPVTEGGTDELPGAEIVRGSTIERPKVVYNEATETFVMWFHLELKGHGYRAARAGVATSDSPIGPFEYHGSVRPNPGVWPRELPDELRERVLAEEAGEFGSTHLDQAEHCFVRDFYGGQMARDMTIFVDDDGTAYHIFASEENRTLHISRLDETYTRHVGDYSRQFIGGLREAPAMFKRGGKYHLITSGCTGWDPNPAQHAVADSIHGPWTVTGNPAVGPGAGITFDSQSTFVLPVVGMDDAFIYMGDRWEPEDPITATYVWLPLRFEGHRAVMEYREEWDLSVFWPID